MRTLVTKASGFLPMPDEVLDENASIQNPRG